MLLLTLVHPGAISNINILIQKFMDDSVTKAQLAPAGGEGGLVGGAVDGGPSPEAVGSFWNGNGYHSHEQYRRG